MEVVNCKECRRLFNAIGSERLCPNCAAKLEEKFQEVKEYLREHPNAHIYDVSNNNDVSVKQVTQWVREERLIFSEDSMDGIECEKCGKRIRTGRFCEQCKNNITNNLLGAINNNTNTIAKKNKTVDKNRMRFLQND